MPNKKSEQFYILDGTAFAYRAFFAIQGLSNSQGLPTNAVFGFARALQKILEEQKPDYIAVSFDLAAPTFRHEQLKEYKAQRPGMPRELVAQLPLIKELLDAYNIRVLQQEGFEADDIMGTMAHKAKAAGIQTAIMTSDKDMLQCVDDHVRVISPAKDALVYDAAAVKKKLGVEPGAVVQLLALTGDAADNIAGVPGIGPKTAAALIAQFGTVQNLFEHSDKIKSQSQRENLLAHRDRVMVNLDLVRVRTDAPVAATVDDCRRQQPDKAKLLDLFRRLEFSALMKEWMSVSDPAPHAAPVLVQDFQDFKRRMDALCKAAAFGFDLVTTAPFPMQAEILGAVFAPVGGGVFYASLGQGISRQEFIRLAGDLLRDPAIGKIGHDLKYDAVVLLEHGVALQGVAFDTMLASYLLNPSKMHHSIGELALEFLNERITTVAEMLGKGKDARAMRDVPASELAQYACAEGQALLRLKHVLEPLLESKQLNRLFYDVEIPLELVLARMEHTGIAVDRDLLRELSKEFENHLQETTRQIHCLAGEEFNIASTKELARVLFEKLKLPAHRKTKTGYSTDVDVLTSLARSHELPHLVLNYRTLAKLKSTYSDSLPTLVNPATGRIHTSFNQTVAATGRLSSSDPNLQNIPVKTAMGLRIRSAFVPGDGSGHVLLGADYSQIELRILAHFSGDENLMEAFRQDADVHRHTASLVFGLGAQEVSDEQRRKAKIVNFGILYGMGAFSLAKDMNVAASEAQVFIDAYFARYHGVRDFIQEILAKARREKCVTTILGRRRYLPEIASTNFSLRQFAERMAVNTVVQGSAADIIKMAMLRLDKDLAGMPDVKVLLQIHDELVLELPRKDVEEIGSRVRSAMENVAELKVPLKVDIKVGKNWAEL